MGSDHCFLYTFAPEHFFFTTLLSGCFNFQRVDMVLNPLNANVCCPHIEASQLICFPSQLTGFYMWATLAFDGSIHL